MKNKFCKVVENILMKSEKNFILLRINIFPMMNKKICKALKVNNKMDLIQHLIYKIFL